MTKIPSETSSKQSLACERSLQVIIDNTRDGMVVVDSLGKVRLVNPAASSMLGTEAAHLQGLLRDIVNGMEVCEMELFDGQGNQMVVEMSSVPIDWQGEAVFLLTFHDVTRRKHIEQELLLVRESLEETVRRRTSELSEANAALTEEIEQRKHSERELIRQKHLLESIITHIPYSISWKDSTLNYMGANAHFVGLWGMDSVENVLGKSVFEIPFDQSLLERTVQTDWAVIESGEANLNQEIAYITPDGEERWVVTNRVPLRDDTGHVIGVIAIDHDITSIKRSEQELKASEARYRAILEDQTELICRYLPDGRLSYVNEAYARYYGRSVSELIHTNFVPDIPDGEMKSIREGVASLSPENPVGTFEHRVRMHDGVHWQFWTHRAIFDEQENLIEIQAVGRDVTKRKLAEDRLKEHQKFLRLIIDTVPSPIFVKNKESEFVVVNKAMAGLYGSTVEEMVGHKGADFNADQDQVTGFTSEDRQVIENRTPLHVPQKVITNARGEDRWFSSVKLPLPGKEQLLGVAVDITERIEAETRRMEAEKGLRQAQKMQALGTLAGGIAHDFNNMIFAILGFVGLAMRQESAEGKLRVYLEQIQSAGQRASALVRQILAFSRRAEQDKQPVQVSLLIKEVAKMLEATLPPSIVISTRLDAAQDTVWADPTQLHQVILNLATNAGHAMREHGGRLELFLENRTMEVSPPGRGELASGTYVVFGVSDTGLGIAPQILDRIFEPFFTTKKPGEGTGMGLSVVHGIVESHAGVIRVQSRVGAGTTMTVFLSLHEQELDCVETPCEVLPRGDERVLFVDDEQLLVSMATDILGQLGYITESATSPLKALELFRADTTGFDLVVSNQSMPEMTGFELARNMLILRPDQKIILLTGFSEELTADGVMAEGICELAFKPMKDADLARLVRRILDNQK